MSRRDLHNPVAEEIPYDDQNIPTNLGDNTQKAIDNLYNKVATSASPGFTWGRSGTAPPNTWLLNDSVPSNTSGRTVFLNNAEIQNVFVANQDATSGIILGVYSHEGNEVNLTLLGTVTTIATRSNTFTVAFPIAVNKQIGIKIMPGSASSKNIVVGILIRGSN